MYRQPVDSSSLVSVGYDPEDKMLEAEFVNGSVYRYLGVPEDLHIELMSAPSLGTFFNAHIREAFELQRVG